MGGARCATSARSNSAAHNEANERLRRVGLKKFGKHRQKNSEQWADTSSRISEFTELRKRHGKGS
jgi:hypothetical protein